MDQLPRPTGSEPERVDTGRRALTTWLWRLPVVAAVAGGVFGVVQAYRIHFSKERADPDPTFDPVERVEVAPLTAFGRVWDGVDFVVGGVPCVAVRLPTAIPGGLSVGVPSFVGDVHLAAFSRVCTHLSCLVELNPDTEAVAFAFNHRSTHPSLTCACHFSVFDPLQAGRAVSGPAVRPLPRARLRIDDADGSAQVVADGLQRMA